VIFRLAESWQRRVYSPEIRQRLMFGFYQVMKPTGFIKRKAPLQMIIRLRLESPMAHIILFEHINFHGSHKHVLGKEPNLNADDDDFFNDRVSSMAILEGTGHSTPISISGERRIRLS
jgi:hypothetical protein